MNNSHKLLIVEGEADKAFMTALLQKENLSDDLQIRVATPTDIDQEQRTTKQSVIQVIETAIKQLNDGKYTHIGILVDMDYQLEDKLPANLRSLQQFDDCLEKHGFRREERQNQETSKGFQYTNDDFEHPIGLWLMPNNHDEGYLEVWLERCLSEETTASHFNKVKAFIAEFGDDHFKHNETKAKIYTLLATQRKPSQTLSTFLRHQALIDIESEPYQSFKNWLLDTFAEHSQ